MARKYDHEYKVQAVKLAKEIGGAKAVFFARPFCRKLQNKNVGWRL